MGGGKAYNYFFFLYTQESKAKIDTLEGVANWITFHLASVKISKLNLDAINHIPLVITFWILHK
jgi:hypothetical protein